MDRLWTPWRFAYVSSVAREDDEQCVFCRILSEERDEQNYLLFRAKYVFIILNIYPYTSGHLLIVSRRHIASLEEAEPQELHSFADLAQACVRALRLAYSPDGFNLGFNLGRSAGAGVERHLHMHVLPRWVGDSSFVSVVSETRVIPEALDQTYRRLLPHFRDLSL